MSDLINNIYQIEYGTTTIDFTLEFSSRKTLGISVTPGLDVRVVLLFNSTMDMIKEKVGNKAKWIVKQKEYLESFYLKPPLENM